MLTLILTLFMYSSPIFSICLLGYGVLRLLEARQEKNPSMARQEAVIWLVVGLIVGLIGFLGFFLFYIR